MGTVHFVKGDDKQEKGASDADAPAMLETKAATHSSETPAAAPPEAPGTMPDADAPAMLETKAATHSKETPAAAPPEAPGAAGGGDGGGAAPKPGMMVSWGTWGKLGLVILLVCGGALI